MFMDIPFVTVNEVQTWVGNLITLPQDIDRLILRASELIRRKTYHRTDDTDRVEDVKNAACAQVEYWLQIDEASDITGPLGPMKIKDFSFNSKFTVLAPRARDLLLDAGLLYKGVDIGRNSYRGMDVK
jgi:hypothetical protein